jgi:hypothetical protein
LYNTTEAKAFCAAWKEATESKCLGGQCLKIEDGSESPESM